MRSLAGLSVILTVALFVSCSGDEGADLTGHTWQLVSLNGAPPVEATLIDMTFEDGMVSGSAGCNSYGGPASYEDGSMTLGPEFITTFMACDGLIMEQEQLYLATLGEVTAYEVVDGELMLQDADGTTIASFE